MKYLIMCEGPNEVTVLNLLLNNGHFSIDRDDILDLRIFHARQIHNNMAVQTAIRMYPDNITVLRIGDTLTDELKIPKEFKGKIVEVKKYCTKPELEILFIIADGLIKDFNKHKSKTSPKSYSKEKIKLGKKTYDCTSAFYNEYFSDCEMLKNAIIEYKRTHKHQKNEYFLADLLK